MYLVKTPWLLRKWYASLTWKMPADEKTIYLTFDDGPHEQATPFVLAQLKQYNAKGTFFCIGKNVVAYPDIYRQVIAEGHAVGNHTHNHVNGWKTGDKQYLSNVLEAAKYIDSDLFRPPYGRITRFQTTLLQKAAVRGLHTGVKAGANGFRIIMWSVLSGDFDVKLSPEQCLQNVLLNVEPGSIVVFHDSTKAWNRLQYALPGVLEALKKQGYQFKSL
ncbi:polysaccharide deacetylase family protein [Deminuibacter soli]|uniref:Polysaccharide deacetylase family protein n=1 Tax=Deminuibacter soli TaxID=2291815 RepID=A0A3E1NP56_9BACT|nr:polysaccharide deacetylase family protein [Deminuibacter soli]RFM29687.1 polysaccharide deacetylase family protein [Deminuibacter soli]